MGLDINFHKVKKEEIGYFRKVNFLVGFFAKKFEEEYDMDEVPNCKGVRITKEMCEELLNNCKEVIADHSKAKDLLPAYPGFFFGSYDYDEYYFDDVKLVKEYCEDELLPEFDDLEDNEEIEFYIWY